MTLSYEAFAQLSADPSAARTLHQKVMRGDLAAAVSLPEIHEGEPLHAEPTPTNGGRPHHSPSDAGV